MNWKTFNNQHLKVADLVWLEIGQLAYVTGMDIPTGLESIPEAWSFDADDYDLNIKLINGKLYDMNGEYVDRILFYHPYQKPTELKQNPTDDHDVVELTFYKENGKMNYVEQMKIPIFLNEEKLVELILEKFPDSLYYNYITITGTYYNRLIKKINK